jgi:hypothetical protein
MNVEVTQHLMFYFMSSGSVTFCGQVPSGRFGITSWGVNHGIYILVVFFYYIMLKVELKGFPFQEVVERHGQRDIQ